MKLLTKRWLATLLLAVGIGLNLGSNFVGGGPKPECVPGTERISARPAPSSGYPGAPLAGALHVDVTCSDRHSSNRTFDPYDLEVQWAVGSGGGTIDGAQTAVTRTGYAGFNDVHWQLGPEVGVQSVTAKLAGGQTATFNATAVLPGPAGDCTDLVGGTNFQQGGFWRILHAETWTASGSPYRVDTVQVLNGGTLTIEPGVRVCALGMTAVSGGRIVARGTAAEPILIEPRLPPRGMLLELSGGVPQWIPGMPYTPLPPAAVPANAAQSELHHVHGEGVLQLRVWDQSLSLQDSRFRISDALRAAGNCGSIFIGSSLPPADLRHDVQRTVFQGYGGPPSTCDAAVRLEQIRLPTPAAGTPPAAPWVFSARVLDSVGDALILRHDGSGPGWLLQQCEISGSGRHGAVFETNAGRVRGCHISDNADFGIVNRGTTPFTVDAADNWWGDAAGPSGPLGDRVSGAVDAAAPLASPPVLGY